MTVLGVIVVIVGIAIVALLALADPILLSSGARSEGQAKTQ